MPMSPYLRKVFANISWLSIDQVIRMAVNTLTGILIARFLGKELYGVFSYATAYIMIFSPLINFGFDALIVRDLLSHPEKKDEIMGSSFLLRIMGAVTAISAVYISILFVRPDAADSQTRLMTHIVSIGMLFQAFDIIDLWFRSILKSKFTVWAKNASFVVINTLKIILIITQSNILYLGVLYVFEMGFGALGLIIIYTRVQGFSLAQWHLTVGRTKYVLKESWPLLISAASTFLYMRIDQVFIGRMLGDGAVGIYSASTKIFELPYVLLTIFNTSFFPMLNELYKTDKDRFYNRYEFISGMYTFISLGILIFTILFADYGVKVLFGNSFSDAAPILKIQIIGLVFLYNSGLRSLYLTITSNQKLLLNTSLTSAIINIILNLILIPYYGITGSAVATVITIAFSLLIQNIFYQQTRKIFFVQLKAILPVLFISEFSERLVGFVRRKLG